VQDATNSWQKDTTRTNSFVYKEQINAAYISGSADWGKCRLQAGVRADKPIQMEILLHASGSCK